MRPDGRQGGQDAWPPARIRLATPELELRLPDEAGLGLLADVAAAGVHEPGTQPFAVPWGAQPSPLRAMSVLQWHWLTRGTWAPERWTLDFAVFLDGRPIGAQSLSAVGFGVKREVATGSWLGQRYQRQGFGRQMRAAVLVLAFGHLGALSAVTGAYEDNDAAIRVNHALGYARDGEEVAERDGARLLAYRFRLTAGAGPRGWPEVAAAQHWPEVSVEGVDDEVLAMCGATNPEGHRALPLGGYPHA